MSAAWGGKLLCFPVTDGAGAARAPFPFSRVCCSDTYPDSRRGPGAQKVTYTSRRPLARCEPGSKSTCVSAGRKLAGPGPPRTGSCDNTRLSLGGI